MRAGSSRQLGPRFLFVPCVGLSFFVAGCPLSDPYSLRPAGDVGDGDDGGAGSSVAGSVSGASAGGGSSAGSVSIEGGSANGGDVNAGSAGYAGNSPGGAGGGAGFGEAGQGASGGDGGASEAGTSGSAGSAGWSGASGSGADSGSGGASGDGSGAASGASGSGGGPSCVPSCNYTCCASGCVDTTRDFRNCGSCGALCSAGRSCTSSECTPGWLSMAAPPTGFVARWRAAAVAMGKSVFIWGGSDSSGVVLDSGAIYSPQNDSWTTIAKDANTPTARVLATAVWTGSVVVVFGGSDATGASPYKDGAIYDPAQDAWRAMPSAGKARSMPFGDWDGSRAIFWGGIAAAGAAVAGVDRFDLATWSSSTLTGDPGALLNPALAWDGTSLYLQGGQLAATRKDGVFTYTSATDTWAAPPKSLSARSNAFGVWDGSHFVVWGGRDDMGTLHADGKYRAGAIWPALSAMNAPTARMMVPRRHGWIFQTSPGKIALFGGQTSLNGQGTFTTTGSTYDVTGAKWQTAYPWPSAETHDYGVGVWTGDEFVLWGGKNGSGTNQSATLTGERWKP